MSSKVVAVVPVLDTAFNRRMAQGHEARMGHAADFRQVSADRVVWHRVRVCCGDVVPETVDTFDKMVTA